jgi:hypothetical protein
MRTAYETSNLQARNDFFRQVCKQLPQDSFYAYLIDESIEVQDRQSNMFRASKNPEVIDSSLANFYTMLQGKDGEQQ